MTFAYWIFAGILAAIMLGSGLMKIVSNKQVASERGMAYVEDFTETQLKLIGLAEALGAFGLILPKALRIAPVLSPVAAVGLFVIMTGAVVVHYRRKESFRTPMVLAIIAGICAVLGFMTL